jgi:hypothetical protein
MQKTKQNPLPLSSTQTPTLTYPKVQNPTPKQKTKKKKIQVMITRLTRPEGRCANYYTNKQHPNFIFFKNKGPG